MTDLTLINEDTVHRLDDDELRVALTSLAKVAAEDRKHNQLRYYKPVSATAAKAFESDAQVLGFGGGNRCVPLHAPILMADASWKELRDVEVGDLVMGADPVTGIAVPSRVLRTFRSGAKEVFRVTFSDGGSFEASADHMVPLYLGSGKTTSKGNGKVAFKRRLGDYIEPIARRGATNASKRISAVSPRDIRFSPEPLPLDPYLLGALLGDGGITKGVKFFSADVEVLARVAEIVKRYGGELRKHSHDYCYGIAGSGKKGGNKIRALIEQIGLLGANSYTKFIPQQYLRASRQDRLSLLAGLVDTDGTRDSYSTCSRRLAEGLVVLVRSLGGKATLAPKISRCQNGVEVNSFSVYMRLNERIPLALPRKQKKNSSREVDYSRRVCRSVESLGLFQCGDIQVDHPAHCYITGDYVIVSNSGKTENILALISACTTGIFPDSMKHTAARRFRGPIKARIICDSLTTVLYPVILPKLQWWQWSGADTPGGERGHWGWIPPYALRDRSWEKSWSEKFRTLTVICRDPENPEVVLGESTIHFMSYDQEEGRGTDYHIIAHDEPPPLHIWRESQARVMGVGGRLLLAMTWPDDPSIPVDWLYDEVYEPGISADDNGIEWYDLYSTDNPNVDQEAIARQANNWSKEMRSVRIYGKPIRFSNRIHSLFTHETQHWCFACKESVLTETNEAAESPRERLICTGCRGTDIGEFNHVREFDPQPNWPAIFLLDPHPRKAHCGMWVLVDPSDDLWQIAEIECAGDPVDMREEMDRIERELDIQVVSAWMDPNMGASPSSSQRQVTWQMSFSEADIACELADDSAVGRTTVNTYLRPDEHTRAPRIHIHPRCKRTIFQLQRFVWDDFKRATEKDQKQVPKAKNDDFPALWRYLMNTNPTFNGLRGLHRVYHRPGTRRGAY